MTRTFITILLVFVLTLSGATRALASTRDDDEKVTPEEEQEARELVEEFNKKFVDMNDIEPLIKDYFVPDFASRLNQHAETFPFQLIDWKDGVAPPDPSDLERFYVASTNFLHMLFPIYGAAIKKCVEEHKRDDVDENGPTSAKSCDDVHELKIETVLPPAAIKIMKSDSFFKEWLSSEESDGWKDDAGNKAGDRVTQESVQPTEDAANKNGEMLLGQECADGCTKSVGSKAHPIEDAEQLRHLTSQFEALSKILREHLSAHPVTFEKKEEVRGVVEEDGEDDDAASFDPEKILIFTNANVLEKEFYGYPEGTRLVCANAGMLHIELVRVDGRLRILTVYLLIDD